MASTYFRFPSMPACRIRLAVQFTVIVIVVPFLINVMINDIYIVMQHQISMLMRLFLTTLALVAFGFVNRFFIEVHHPQDQGSNLLRGERVPQSSGELLDPLVTDHPYAPRIDPEVRSMVEFWNEQRGCELRDYVSLTIPSDIPCPLLEAQFGVKAHSGSKLLRRRLEIGPQTRDYELQKLSSEISESMRLARAIDENCTLQLGSCAVMKYTDAGLKWWKLQKQWTPTICCMSTSWDIWDFITGQKTKWSMRGFNLQNATLKVSSVDEKEDLKIFTHHQKSNGEDVLLFEEPCLVWLGSPSFPKELYVYAIKFMDVEDGVTFHVQSKPKSVCKAYWISVAQCLNRHSKWKMIGIGTLIINGTLGRCFGQALKAPSTSQCHFQEDTTIDVNVGFKVNSITSLFFCELAFFLVALTSIIVIAKIGSILQRLLEVRQAGYSRGVSGSATTSTAESSELFSRDTVPSGDVIRTSEDTVPSGDVLRTSPDTLTFGDVLRTNETLVSRNGMYTLVNQEDGVLCIYNNNTSSAIWTSGISSHGVGNLCFKRDGNIVFYDRDGDVEDPDAQIWTSSSRSRKATGRYKLIMQGDGNLVIYDANHKPIWSTNTSITPSSVKGPRRKMKKLLTGESAHSGDVLRTMPTGTDRLDSGDVLQTMPTGTDRLHSGDVLRTNEELVSKNGMYRFVNQADGDLCIYNTQNSTRSWASGTHNQGAGILYVQKNGQLILYKTDHGNVVDPSAAMWSAKGKPGPGPHKLIMQDNGHLLVYDNNDKPLWASNGSFTRDSEMDKSRDTLASGDFLRPEEELISTNGLHTFVNQGDGNLCLYLNRNWTCRWASGTYNRGIGNMYLQTNGNLMLYNMDGDNVDLSSPIWSSGSNKGNGQYKLIMQDDGNVVIYDADRKPIWATNTVQR